MLTKKTTLLTYKEAKHLANRLSFGGSLKSIQNLVGLTPTDACEVIFNKKSHPIEALNKGAKDFFLDIALTDDVCWYAKGMAFYSLMMPARLIGGHAEVKKAFMRLLEWAVTNSYRDVIEKLCSDMNMGRRLDLFENIVNSTNDNFAREIIELFTIGHGKIQAPGDYTYYTENDIELFAKCFTGFRYHASFDDISKYDNDLKVPKANLVNRFHDTSDKQFSAAFNNTLIKGENLESELPKVIDMIFSNPQAAKYYATRLYRYYVNDVPNNALIDELAQVVKDSNFSLEESLKALVTSSHFYETVNIGTKVSEPLQLFLNTVNKLNATPSLMTRWIQDNNSRLHDMGQPLFDPEDISGFKGNFQGPGYSKMWIDTSSLQFRYSHISELITNSTVSLFYDEVSSKTLDEAINIIVNYLIVEDVPKSKKEIYKFEALQGGDESHWNINSNNDQINIIINLVKSITKSAEYQII